MVGKKMVGIFELMTDDRFLSWVEKQSEALLATLSTLELYKLYQSES